MNKTVNLKEALKKLILSDTDSPAEMLAEVKQHLAIKKPDKTISLHRASVKSIKKIRKADDEYVYDIGMRNENKPWFFGNNILLHNSVYFSAYPTLKVEIDKGEIHWGKDTVLSLYDTISDEVNSTFPAFMSDGFHCPKSRGEVIKAGREIVASKGLFITKKRYAVLYYDKDGKRQDTNGKEGKIKVMGLDLKRSDTPEFMQTFLEEILTKVLYGAQEKEILARVSEFRSEFKAKPGWEKGSPKRANNIAEYQKKEEKGKTNMPGHVRASINWNTLKRMNGDKYSINIVDGMKIITCKMKANPLGYTSVAYPVDELRVPQWFQNLPFDHDAMELSIVDGKLENLIGVLDWDLNSTTNTNNFGNLFSFD